MTRDEQERFLRAELVEALERGELDADTYNAALAGLDRMLDVGAELAAFALQKLGAEGCAGMLVGMLLDGVSGDALAVRQHISKAARFRNRAKGRIDG